MEVAALAMQQVVAQSAASMSMIKQAAQADQALVDLVSQTASSSPFRGQNLDVSV